MDQLNNFAFESNLKLNIEDIDNQHTEFIYILNKLNEADEEENLPDLFEELDKFVTYHFKSEENYIKKIRPEDYLVHKNKHDILLAKLKLISIEFEYNLVDKNELLTSIHKWFIDHIKEMDSNII